MHAGCNKTQFQNTSCQNAQLVNVTYYSNSLSVPQQGHACIHFYCYLNWHKFVHQFLRTSSPFFWENAFNSAKFPPSFYEYIILAVTSWEFMSHRVSWPWESWHWSLRRITTFHFVPLSKSIDVTNYPVITKAKPRLIPSSCHGMHES